jgi:hypothetical protein
MLNSIVENKLLLIMLDITNRLYIDILTFPLTLTRSWGSSVSIVLEYRLDDRGLIRDRDKLFFL